MSRVLRQWSHYGAHQYMVPLQATLQQPAGMVPTFSFRSASLSGRPGRFGGGTAAAFAEFASAIVSHDEAAALNRSREEG